MTTEASRDPGLPPVGSDPRTSDLRECRARSGRSAKPPLAELVRRSLDRLPERDPGLPPVGSDRRTSDLREQRPSSGRSAKPPLAELVRRSLDRLPEGRMSYFVIALHGHLPFIHHPEHEHFLE